MDSYFWKKPIFPAIAVFAAWGLLLFSLNPTFYVDDSPETVTAAVLLGVPHPPGDPFYTLLSALFAKMPLGAYPFRVNLCAALAALAHAALASVLLRALGLKFPAAVLGGALVLFGSSAFMQALSAKGGVYHVTGALVLAMFLALVREKNFLFFFLFGLALAHHWMSVIVFAPGFLFLLWRNFFARRSLGEWFRASAFFLIGLSLFLYLPLRAAFDPWLDWGDPDRFSRFWFNLTRAQYSGAEAALSPVAWGRQFSWLLQAFFKEYFVLFPILLVGGWLGWKKAPCLYGKAFLWSILFFAGAIVFYLNLEEEKRYLVSVYSVSAFGLFSVWALFGLFSLAQAKGPKVYRFFIFALAAVVFLSTGFRVWRDRQNRYFLTWDYTLNQWRGLPRGALLLARGDSVIFPSWYFQWVEKKRPDIVVAGLDGLPMEWIRRVLARAHRNLTVPFPEVPVGVEAIGGLGAFLMERNPTRPVFLSYNRNENPILPGGRPIPLGLAYRLPRPLESVSFDAAANDVLWRTYRYRALWKNAPVWDRRSKNLLLRDYAVNRNSLGVFYEDAADGTNDPFQKEAFHRECLRHFSWAVRLFPEDAEFLFNLGNAWFRLGDYEKAAQSYVAARKQNPRYVPAYYNGAVAAIQLRRWREAGELLEAALDLQPGYEEARKAMEYLKENRLFP